MIKTAIVGFGMSAKTFHIPFIRQSSDFKLVAISTSQSAQAQVAFPHATIYANAFDMIRDADVDLVIITSPNAVHYELALACLEANHNVVVEKPFVTNIEDGMALMRLAKEKGLALSVFQNRRWDGDFLTVRSLIQGRLLGKMRSFESHFDRFRPTIRDRWREQKGVGTGIWYDLGPHLIDQSLSLFGLPTSVTARCIALRNKESVCDYFHVQLHYAMGDVILHSSPYAAGPNMRFHIQGTQGTYIKYGLDPQEERLAKGQMPTSPEWSQESKEAFGTLYTENGKQPIPTLPGAYQNFYTAMAAAIQSGSAVPVDPWDAILGIYIIQLAEQSSASGRRLPVVAPLRGDGT